MSSIPIFRMDGETAEKLHEACRDVGFFYLQGHGIEAELIAAVREQTQKLFDLPEASKKAMSDKKMSRGYTAMGEETLDPANQTKGDTKEGERLYVLLWNF